MEKWSNDGVISDRSVMLSGWQLGFCIVLLPQNFIRVAQLNAQYADLPRDFADLSLIAISERLDILVRSPLQKQISH